MKIRLFNKCNCRYLKTVDRFNDLTVSGFVTASRILLNDIAFHVVGFILL